MFHYWQLYCRPGLTDTLRHIGVLVHLSPALDKGCSALQWSIENEQQSSFSFCLEPCACVCVCRGDNTNIDGYHTVLVNIMWHVYTLSALFGYQMAPLNPNTVFTYLVASFPGPRPCPAQLFFCSLQHRKAETKIQAGNYEQGCITVYFELCTLNFILWTSYFEIILDVSLLLLQRLFRGFDYSADWTAI